METNIPHEVSANTESEYKGMNAGLLSQVRNISVWLKVFSIAMLLVIFAYLYLAVTFLKDIEVDTISMQNGLMLVLFFGGPIALSVAGIFAASAADKSSKTKSNEDHVFFLSKLKIWFAILGVLMSVLALLLLIAFISIAELWGGDMFF